MARQKLMTKAIENALTRNPLNSTDGTPTEAKKVLVKFFGGAATWIVFEGEKQENGDWTFFGLADLGMGCPELGYFSLNELAGTRFQFGGIERDYYGPKHVTIDEGRIVEL